MDSIEFEDHVFLVIDKMRSEYQKYILEGISPEMYLNYLERIRVLYDVEDRIREKM